MKINLYGREAELVETLRLVGGYETMAAVVRKLVNDYYSDLHDRLSRTGTAAVPQQSFSGASDVQISSTVVKTTYHSPATDPQENPTPEW